MSISQIDQYINTVMTNNHISGLAANIVVGKEVVWKSSYGLANRGTNLSVTDDTPFLMYSMTKSVTGVALLQLLEAKNISLDEPINDYLPFTVKHPNHKNTQITIRMLMGHVSGILNRATVVNQVFSFNEDTPISLETFLKDYLTPTGRFYSMQNFGSKPGTRFSYSNIGATLAGYLIECISGQSYEEYCIEHVLQPLGMSNSQFNLSEINLPDNL